MKQKVMGKITEFRVYQCIRKIMETENRCPLGAEVAEIIGISDVQATMYMRKLSNADGLPMKIIPGRTRTTNAVRGSDRLKGYITNWHMEMGHNFDENSLELDELITP